MEPFFSKPYFYKNSYVSFNSSYKFVGLKNFEDNFFVVLMIGIKKYIVLPFFNYLQLN
jgi:hypothetical protein